MVEDVITGPGQPSDLHGGAYIVSFGGNVSMGLPEACVGPST